MSVIVTWLPAIQISLSALLVGCILLQERGTGIGSSFGGSSAIYRTKRGVEKILFRATIVFGLLFTATSLIRLVV